MTMEQGSRARRWPLPALAAAACALAAGCAGQAEVPPAEQEPFERVVNVETLLIEARPVDLTIRLVGVVKALQDVTVSAEEPGVVRRILKDKGARVRAGEVLMRLDTAVLAAEVRAATADAEYEREMWERRKRLYEEDSIGSEALYLEARAAAERARARLDGLQERLARTAIRAPISGVLDDRMVEVGSLVGPGTPVLRIVRVDSVKVTAGVPERFAADVVPGAVASVTFDALEGESLQAPVRHAGAAVDPDSRTFPVEFVVPNRARAIKPEMLASVTIVQERIPDAISVPQEALVSMDYGHVVFVVDGAGDEARVRASRVEVLASQGNDAVIAQGVNPGDHLVVVGQQGLTAGDRVRVVSPASQPAARE